MTFDPVICEECNNKVSQPWDVAYDRFTDWFVCNKQAVIRGKEIDFEVVYGSQWPSSQLSLFRYYAKHLGCSIASGEGHDVPADLREVLFKSPFRTALRVAFEIHEDRLLGPGLDEGLALGPLGHYPPDETGVPSYWGSITVGWLTASYCYNTEIPSGATGWIADAQVLRLGAYSVLTEAEREEVRRRGAGFPHRQLGEND